MPTAHSLTLPATKQTLKLIKKTAATGGFFDGAK